MLDFHSERHPKHVWHYLPSNVVRLGSLERPENHTGFMARYPTATMISSWDLNILMVPYHGCVCESHEVSPSAKGRSAFATVLGQTRD